MNNLEWKDDIAQSRHAVTEYGSYIIYDIYPFTYLSYERKDQRDGFEQRFDGFIEARNFAEKHYEGLKCSNKKN